MIRHPPDPPFFPCTTLFRSFNNRRGGRGRGGAPWDPPRTKALSPVSKLSCCSSARGRVSAPSAGTARELAYRGESLRAGRVPRGAPATPPAPAVVERSEERRAGEEGRIRWVPNHLHKN